MPLLALVLLLLSSFSAAASTAPRWSDEQLAAFASHVVQGRVSALASGLEPETGQFYTYVTIDVNAVLKGAALPPRIVLKQLGGSTGAEGVIVPGQARFAPGEDVIVFLEVRPRDRTLYTAAFEQGKWTGVAGAMARAVAAIEAAARDGLNVPLDVGPVNTSPADARYATSPYVLFNPPARWNEATIFVDFENSAQPGLAGGGFQEVLNAFAQWNNAGGSVGFHGGGTRTQRCLNTNEANGRIVVTFSDPCGEVSNSGSTVAYAQYYYLNAGGQTVNGTAFRRIVQATVTTNDTTNARSFLSNAACFQSTMLHELGHTLGFDHTTDTSAIMYPTISSTCRSGPLPLGADDIAALRFSYPSSVTPPSSAPSNVQVAVNGTSSLVVSWNAVTSDAVSSAPSAATAYRVDFRQAAGGAVLASVTTAATSVTLAIPAGTTGTFLAQVTAINSAGVSAASTPVSFTIGGSPSGCTSAPAAPSNVGGSVAGGVARLSWTGSAGATSYIVRAGSSSGASNLFNGDVGPSTSVTSPVGAGFRAFVRVFAANACGESGPSAELVIQ